MALDTPNPGKTLSVDDLILEDLKKIKDKQDERPCVAHTIKIEGLVKSDDEQWDAINQLRKTVWGWAGAIALGGFLGSILGTIAIHRFLK